ncbi:MAG: hypothetical protein M3P23_08835 [Actinomycetota bacterium]|nr:hypothetical protein [Actinomycetota bacterium]
MAKRQSTPSGLPEARSRLRAAGAYLEVADLVLAEHQGEEFLNVAAGLAVLAGIAASDAICSRRLGQIHRGDDHRAAADLLARATPDGAKLAATFRRLIDVKDEAHHGVGVVAASKARNTLRWAQHLVDRARQEVER